MSLFLAPDWLFVSVHRTIPPAFPLRAGLLLCGPFALSPVVLARLLNGSAGPLAL